MMWNSLNIMTLLLVLLLFYIKISHLNFNLEWNKAPVIGCVRWEGTSFCKVLAKNKWKLKSVQQALWFLKTVLKYMSVCLGPVLLFAQPLMC